MKKMLIVLVLILFCREVWSQELRTLGGFGAGGMNGNGFGDPVANDYAGIDWGYDFQTGLIINGYNNPRAAAGYANSMARRDAIRNRRYNEAFGNGRPNQQHLDPFERMKRNIEAQMPFLK